MDFLWIGPVAGAAGVCGAWMLSAKRRRPASPAPAAPTSPAAAAPRARRALVPLQAACRDVAAARDRTSLARSLAHAVDHVFDPSQVMVFVATDDDPREFVLVATAGDGASPWPIGARLTDTTGRLGLVARRKVAMDDRDFAAQPPLVREQIDATEPAEFVVDAAAPVVLGDATWAVVSVGGSALSPADTRDGLALLAAHAATTLSALRESVLATSR